MEEALEEAMSKDLWGYFSQIWSSIVVALLIYFGGVSTKRVLRIWVPKDTPVAKQPRWYRLWDATIDYHPIVVGGVLGIAPWATPDFIHDWWARILWFMGVGASSGQVYRILNGLLTAIPDWIRQKMGLAPKKSPQSDPAPPPDPSPVDDGDIEK